MGKRTLDVPAFEVGTQFGCQASEIISGGVCAGCREGSGYSSQKWMQSVASQGDGEEDSSQRRVNGYWVGRICERSLLQTNLLRN